MDKVNLAEKFSLFSEHWSPRVAGELNGQQVKLSKLKGEFVWHHHDQEDELFLVVKGSLLMRLRDRDIEIKEGEFFIVPRGVEHQPFAEEEVQVLMFLCSNPQTRLIPAMFETSALSKISNTSNNLVNRTPGKLRLPVSSALRAPVAGYLKRYEKRLQCPSSKPLISGPPLHDRESPQAK